MATPRSRRRQRQAAARHQQQQQQQQLRKQQQEPTPLAPRDRAPPARTPSPAEDGEELLFGSPPSSPASEPVSPSSGVLKSFAAVPLAEVEDKAESAAQPSSDFAEVLRLLAQQGSLFEASPEEHLKEDPPSTRRQPSGRAEPSLAEVEAGPMSAEMSSIWREETGAGGSQFGWVPAPPRAYVPHNQLQQQQQAAAAAYHQQLYHQHQMHLQEYQQQVVPVHC